MWFCLTAPSEVRNVQLEETALRTVQVTWKHPEYLNGILSYYALSFSGRDPTLSQVDCLLYANLKSFVSNIGNLKSFVSIIGNLKSFVSSTSNLKSLYQVVVI